MIKRLISYTLQGALWLASATSAFAQSTATSSATKGGTSSSLPAAGTTELTYFLLIGGAILFTIGSLKLILSIRE